MAVIFCGAPRTFMSASAGSARPAACLSNGALNLPTLNGFPPQSETCAPAIYFDNCKSQLIGIQSSGATGWAAGGNLITSINQGNGGGTQNSAYTYGGTTSTGNPAVTTTQEYNGSTWATGGALTTAFRLFFRGCVGTQNAGLSIFGISAAPAANTTCTMEYNGTAWSAGGAGAISVRNGAAFGTQNSATAAGGFTTAEVTCTQEYNGATWSAGGNLIGTRQSNNGAGTSQNTGWSTGGGPGPVTCTETYNGTAWSTSGALPACRQLGSTSGRQCYGFWAGGFGTSTTNEVYLFDGYLWTSTCGLITAVACNAAGGDASEGVVFSGQNTSLNIVACTQDWNNPWNYYQLE